MSLCLLNSTNSTWRQTLAQMLLSFLIAICLTSVACSDPKELQHDNPIAQCGTMTSNSRTGEIVSHKAYASCPYPIGMKCTWTINAIASDPDSRLAISFDAYELPKESQPCSRTFLKFIDANDPAQKPFKSLCEGRTIPASFNSTSNKVVVEFNTNDFGAKGFIMKWKVYRICRPTDFQCNDGFCIKQDYRCDGGKGGEHDCSDGTDEVGCKPAVCKAGETPCDHKLRCYPTAKQCDGFEDCRGGSDEMVLGQKCPTVTCAATEFRCAHGLRCIPHKMPDDKVCDGVKDCTDNSDEDSATCKPQTCDANTQFRCDNTFACIDKKLTCDAVKDCNDGSDEKRSMCPDAVCKAGETPCDHKLRCYQDTKKCDGYKDCRDGSDEKPLDCPDKTCSSAEFRCAHKKRCIPKEKFCDGVKNDCTDNSDEATCTEKTCVAGNEFRCANKFWCIPSNHKCDGVKDCNDGSDESGCKVATCTGGQLRCDKGLRCVERTQLCDGTQHCRDGSDEDGGCKTACSPGGYRCLNKNCVGPLKVCNTKDDCLDNSDEFNCPSITSCQPNQFKCKIPRCVDSNVRCNMVNDCDDNSDEEGCPHTAPGGGPPCLLNHVYCRGTKRCIKASLACNGVSDCGDKSDNSDEENCATDVCAAKWFACANSQYIAMPKKCDGTHHCADGSDEKNCPTSG